MAFRKEQNDRLAYLALYHAIKGDHERAEQIENLRLQRMVEQENKDNLEFGP